MNADFLDIFVNGLGLDEPDRKLLKIQIALYAFERAAVSLGDQLSPDGRDLVSEFLTEPTADRRGRFQDLFAADERQSVLVASFLAVVQDLADDPKVVDPERRDGVLADMEQFLESKQALAPMG